MPETAAEATIPVKDAVEYIRDGTHGQFFAVEFTKKSGEVRHMTCKYGVRSRLAGGEAAYKFSDYGLVCVWDTVAQEYRTINIPGLLRIRIGKVWRKVVH